MKPYKLEPGFYIIFTLVTLIPALWLARFVQETIEKASVWEPLSKIVELKIFEAPTTVIIIGLLFWVYESFLWRVKPFTYLNGVPNISGRYTGEVESSYDRKKYPIVLEIRQTLLSVGVCLYTERSSSYSIIANVGRNERHNDFLAYIYKNTPKTVSGDLDMRTHDGFACLEIFEKGKNLEGSYFNDPRERGTYGKLSCKKEGPTIKGRF